MCLLAAILFSTGVSAQTEATKKEIQTAQEEALKVMVQGPATIRFKDQANFSLPKGDGFIPVAAAARYLRAAGDIVDEKSLLGLIVPLGEGASWLALVSLQQDGYVRDDDARDWKADDMLENLKKGTEQANTARKERGIPELEVSGWAELPNYDPKVHRLYWSAIIRNKGHAASDADIVNYRTIALGRDGFLSLTMVTRLSQLMQDKPTANYLLADIKFDDGKRYTDFSAATDHIAEYGLGALIVGVAVKKLGFIALILAFAAKFLKVGLLAAAAFGISIKKFFMRKPKVPAMMPTPMQEPALLSTDSPAVNAEDK
ncbi:MAG: hypothetical protein JWQ10_1485 [Herbaspirillum sp.]|nr:hypothetical protein [Herbaspirillum sp.]